MRTATWSAFGPVALAGFSLALAAGIVFDARLPVIATLGSVALVALAVKADQFWWGLFVCSLGGALVLGYGFANLGVPSTGLPIPLTEFFALLLLARILSDPRSRIRGSPPFVFATCFIALATARLFIDVEHWGKYAVRDFTIAIELVFLLIGYWALRTYGLERWIRVLSWVFLISLAYLALYPWETQLAAASPVVGLQRPVPLFGNYSGSGVAAAAGLLFFALLRPLQGWSYAAAAAFFVPIGLLQSRGMYLALPAAVMLIWLVARRGGSTRIRRGLVASLAIGACALTLLFTFAPEGRLGRVSPAFVAAQLGTLVGAPGPGGGSFQQRVTWSHEVIEKVNETPGGWLIGVGVGPDLTFGWTTSPDVRVGKPHNDYLEIFARFGLVGLAFFLAVLATAMTRVIKAARRAAEVEARFLWWVAGTAVVYMIIAATQPLLAFPYGTVPLFSILGAGLAIGETRANNSRPGDRSERAERCAY